MSKESEKCKKYLYNNFAKILNYVDEKDEFSNDWYDELVSYNNIMGSLIGIIDSKGTGKEFQDCKDLVLRYYESTYPEKQLDIIDEALYSKHCFQYINYGLEHLITDKVDLNLLKEFSKSYLKGYNLGNKVSLKIVLPYYVKKMYQYKNKLNKKEQEKLYML